MKLSLILLASIQPSKQTIKNIHVPSCKNCIYFQPSNSNTNFASDLNKCMKFGEKNIISDEIKYEYADLCRKDENKCGELGKHFELKKKIELKIVKHYLSSRQGIIIFVFGLITYISFYINYLVVNKI
jgi:hypothetical protein